MERTNYTDYSVEEPEVTVDLHAAENADRNLCIWCDATDCHGCMLQDTTDRRQAL